jgi:adenosylcobinamide kinase/adenosylcobinamide-phosphate guanylyltransferase
MTGRITRKDRKLRAPSLTLVIGGASSGKSAFAEELVERSGLGQVYVATAEVRDREMERKIAAHRARREGRGWRTLEEPLDLVGALSGIGSGEIVLVDCMTLWLTNRMLGGWDVDAATEGFCAALARNDPPVVLVTNDVSGGIVPDNALARAFRGAQGRLNQRLAAEADLVVQVTAGLPLVLKGDPGAIAERNGGAPAW